VLNLTPLEQVHFDTLTKWRKAMDLVGPGPLEPHFEDASRAVEWIGAEGRWADLGSGAGFPGIALSARYSDISVTLVESRQKRVMFLREVISRGTVDNVDIFHGRSETLEKEVYDGVISRAFRPPSEFLAEARGLLVVGGTAVLMMARGEPPVLEGLDLFHVEQYSLGDRPRKACGYRKRA
jgi:16S rRNA (guanine527-N7)-methyltransferase